MKTISILLLALIFQATNAQPGGGGGIIISDFKVDGKIIANNNPDLIINQYQLSKNLKKIKQKLPNETTSRWWSGEINISPGSFLLMQPYQRTKKTLPNYLTNQRLELIYKKDTMCIDFANVLPRSVNGTSDLINEINFVKGHFIFYRNPKQDLPLIWKSLTEGMQHEITENRMKIITRENIRFLDDLGFVKIVDMPLKTAIDFENNIDYPVLDRAGSILRPSVYDIAPNGVLRITTDQEPLSINNMPQYNFRYHWINDNNNGVEKVGYPAQSKEREYFRQILLNKNVNLSVNKKPYSGVLKIVFLSEVLSQPVNPQNPFLTNTLIERFKLYYKNGVQYKQEVY